MAMAMTMTSPSRHLLIRSPNSTVRIIPKNVLSCHAAIFPAKPVTYQGELSLTTQNGGSRLSNNFSFSRGCLRSLVKPIYAATGLEASVADDESLISVKNAKIVVESQDAETIKVRVDVDKEDTRIVFDKVLTNLARTAPPVPGFRRQKGGKTSKVPRDFMLQILGEDRVTNFVIREIITSSLTDYVKKENLAVKDNKLTTTQTADELKSSFTPGSAFGFNAILELEKSENEAATT